MSKSHLLMSFFRLLNSFSELLLIFVLFLAVAAGVCLLPRQTCGRNAKSESRCSPERRYEQSRQTKRSNAFSDSVSHSQITITRQPSFFSAA